MTIQEEIREGIEDFLLEYCNCDSVVHCNWANALNDGVVGEILKFLDGRNVRICSPEEVKSGDIIVNTERLIED